MNVTSRDPLSVIRDDLLIMLVRDLGGSVTVTTEELHRSQTSVLVVQQNRDATWSFELRAKQ